MLMLASGAVDRVFEPWMGQAKDYKIGIGCFSACSIKEKEQRLVGIRIMCPNGAKYLPSSARTIH